MVAVPPATPCTMPVLPTVAVPVDPELHVPPEVPVASLSVVFDPAQTVRVPVIVPATGNGFTVTEAVAFTVPQLFATI